jgi:hypothetical protein
VNPIGAYFAPLWAISADNIKSTVYITLPAVDNPVDTWAGGLTPIIHSPYCFSNSLKIRILKK